MKLTPCSSARPGPVSELAQIDQTVIRTFTTFALRLHAAQPYINLFVTETAEYLTVSAKERQALALSGTAGKATDFVRWCAEKMQETQGRAEYLFQPSAVNPDGSVVQGKAKEAWKQVKEVLDGEVVEKLVVEVAGRGGSFLSDFADEC